MKEAVAEVRKETTRDSVENEIFIANKTGKTGTIYTEKDLQYRDASFTINFAAVFRSGANSEEFLLSR